MSPIIEYQISIVDSKDRPLKAEILLGENSEITIVDAHDREFNIEEAVLKAISLFIDNLKRK